MAPLASSPAAIQVENEIKGFSESLVSIWNQWEIRGLLFIGILAHIILHLFGELRKYKYYWFRFSHVRDSLLWCLYLCKDWVAGFALGVISNKLGKVHCNCKCHNDTESAPLMAFWAAFFLFLPGGPDNMTAYALEDNELWLRHIAGLVGQASMTAYIIVLSWDISSPFSLPSILMFILGFIKYGERIWTLYTVSIKHRSSSVYRLDFDEDLALPESNAGSNKQRFRFLFISLFTDVVLSNSYIEREMLHFRGIDFQEAFDIVRSELSFAYDVFYTKALIGHRFWGFISPFTTLTAVFYMLSAAYLSEFPIADPNDSFFYMLSLSLLSVSESLSILNFWLPSFTSHRLGARVPGNWWLSAFTRIRDLMDIDKEDEMPLIIQYDFLVLWKNNKRRLTTLPCEMDMSFNFSNANHCSNLTVLMEIIFNNLKHKSVTFTSSNKPKFRDHILEYDRSICWASELKFQRCIVLWHVATGICYYSDDAIKKEDEVRTKDSRESKNLSDYMFYLLLECRNMLPVGSGLVTLQDTCYEAINFLHSKDVPLSNAREAYRTLLQFQPQAEDPIQDQSMLSRACGLARDLLARDRNQTWRFLAELWVEMLGFAAANCGGKSHAQQLRTGGELLSEVWLLQAHFRVLDQFMVAEMHQAINRNTQ